uniref:Uncharacterized protein n=1 Tax=Panagrolaimus davidi TaxID=227884 RepID=A0A914P5J0_9BILA
MDDQQTLPSHFQNELDLLKNEIDELKKLNDNQKDVIYDQAMTIRELKKEGVSHKDEIKKLQSICDKSEKKINDLKAKMVETENQNINQRKYYQTETGKLKAIVETRNKRITELNATIKNHEKVEYNFRLNITELEKNYKAALERGMEINREIKNVKEKMKKMADEIKKCKSESVSGIQEQSSAVSILPTPAKTRRPRKIQVSKRGGQPPKAILPPPPSSNKNVTQPATISVKRGRPKKAIN